MCTVAPQAFSAHAAVAAEVALDLPVSARRRQRRKYFTVSSQDGETRYRVRASIEPRATSYVLLTAASLSDVDATLSVCC